MFEVVFAFVGAVGGATIGFGVGKLRARPDVEAGDLLAFLSQTGYSVQHSNGYWVVTQGSEHAVGEPNKDLRAALRAAAGSEVGNAKTD